MKILWFLRYDTHQAMVMMMMMMTMNDFTQFWLGLIVTITDKSKQKRQSKLQISLNTCNPQMTKILENYTETEKNNKTSWGSQTLPQIPKCFNINKADQQYKN